ncbi:MAG: transcription termination/antitermination NusG family protein, partial [Ginsengibacter sp.]
MQKNWYAVYTKPQCEKKVAAVLTKWKIENFCPLKIVKINLLGRIRLQYEPLFKSYVFLYISKDQICRLDKISGVVN